LFCPPTFDSATASNPGQEFDVERIEGGEYRLKRREPSLNEGLVEWLSACPEEFLRSHRIRIHRRSVNYLVDANVLSEVTKPIP